jgi:peptidoglycan/xylan/chitin deacetylase (PgdA/CDA1 family)
MLTILEFHNISERGVGWTNVLPQRFEKILDLLLSKTQIIEPLELQSYLREKKHTIQPSVMLSFDDGYKEILTKAYPVMKERGLAGMVSIVVGYTGFRNKWDIMGGHLEHLGWDEISQLLEDGWSICSHTITHPDLKRCTDDRLKWELELSKRLLEQNLKIEVQAIAYPFGRFNLRVLKAVHKAGYRIGFTVGAEPWSGPRVPLTTIRVPVYKIDGDSLILAKVQDDGLLKRFDSMKNRAFNKMSLATSFVKRHHYKGTPKDFFREII